MKYNISLFVIFFILFVGCNSFNKKKDNQELAQHFFENYASRKDYKKMLSYYNDSIIYENATQSSGEAVVDPRYLLNDIIRWDDKTMEYKNNKMLEVKELFSNDSVIIANGEFSEYSYNGQKFAPMKFTTYLYLDKNSKIKKQVDWFNYPIEDIIELYQLQQNQQKLKLDK